jgi:HAE1 family hydrophobic/amphiphilic exporter-1
VQWLAELCVRRPVFALMLIAAMVVAGGAAFLGLGVDRLPRMDLPMVNVTTIYPGASPEEIESEVTEELEDAVATVEGIDEFRSISSEGSSRLLISFNLDRNIDVAAQDVRDKINSVVNRLPPGTLLPVLTKSDTDSSPIISLAVSGPYLPRQLYRYADEDVKKVIESAKGVGDASINGATDRAVKVNIEANKLAAYNLSIMHVHEALRRQNVEVPGGRVDRGTQELGLVVAGRLDKTRRFEDLVVATMNGNTIRLGDLGEVVDDTKEVRSLARLDGEPAVIVRVQRQSGANTVEVIEAVKKRLVESRRRLPKDVQITIIQDQSEYINAALHEIEGHLVIGSILATVVVLLFMRSWRSTIISGVAIPASIIATFAFIRWFDFTLNNVTMLALVLMVGVVIDDAIVVLENVYHCIEEKGMSPREATIHGTREIGLAVLATTLSLVIVFLPVSFLSSITGRMLFEFGMTATMAILVSMVISFTLTPMMCSRMLLPAAHSADGPASRRGFYHRIELAYDWCLRQSLRYRAVVMVVSLLVIASNVPLYRMVKQDYVPTNVDESQFEVNVTIPEGATVATMDETMRCVEAEIGQIRGVKHMMATIGGRISQVNAGEVFVKLHDITERSLSFGRLWKALWAGDLSQAFEGNFSQRDVMQEVRARLRQWPELRVSVRNLTSLRTSSPVDIDFVVTGYELKSLSEFCEKLRLKVAEIPGIVDVDTTLRLNKPELHVEIDRERAAALGVDVREIADTLRVAVGGDDRVSRYLDQKVNDAYDVELRLVGLDRSSRESIQQLYVRTSSTKTAASNDSTSSTTVARTRLDNVIKFRDEMSAARIDHIDRQRMCAVRANVAPGYALADRLDAVHAAVEELGLPAGYTTRVIGRGRELERTFADFAWTFVLSFIFMYIILAAQFEHLIHPLTILFSLPLAVPFGLISLYWGDETLNLYSAVGILVLLGVVKKASILQVDHINQLRLQGLDRTTAILQGNRDRLRPILMTTIAFVAGMLPLLIATGPGAEERRSIAVLAVGGQTLSLLLTLLAVPVLYSYFDDLGAWLGGRRGAGAKPQASHEPV